ncbi:hypothetical protein Hanom_Chr03g00246881 [Helianthus anomalus]
MARFQTIVTEFAQNNTNFELVRFVPYEIRIRSKSLPIREFRVWFVVSIRLSRLFQFVFPERFN